MPLYRIADKIVLFVHIPKTGGTSVENVLRKMGSEALFAPARFQGMSCVPQHFHAELLQTVIRPDFVDYAFCIVRNPLDRLISEFFHFHGIRNRRVEVDTLFSKKKVLLQEATPKQLKHAFAGWARQVFQQFREDPFVSDNHIRPQVEFSRYPGIEITRFEDGLPMALERLGRAIGVPVPETDHHNASRRSTVGLDRALRREIGEFYAEDFSELGYDLPQT